MRAVAAAIAAMYALLIMAIALPWDEAECARSGCVASDADAQIFSLGFSIAALLIPTIVVMIILRAILGFRATRDPEAGAVLAALGQTRGAAVRVAALEGLRDGAIAVGLTYLATGGIHIAMLAGSGLPPITTVGEYWAARAGLGGIVVLALVIPHVLAAAQRPRTPVDALTADMEQEPEPRPSLKLRAMLSGGTFALAGGVIAGLAYSMRDTPWTEVGFVATNTAGIAMIVAWVSVITFGLWVVVPWLRSRRSAVTGLASRAVGRDSRVSAVLSSYAGDRSRASARIVTVLAGLGFLIAALPSLEQRGALEDGFLSSVLIEGDVEPSALAESYESIEGVEQVIVAEAALLGENSLESFVYAVTPDSVRQRDGALAEALEKHPNAIVAPLWNGEAPMELLSSDSFDVDMINPLPNCCGAFINADHVEIDSAGPGYLIFIEPQADPDTINAAIDDVTNSTPGVTSWGGSMVTSGSGNNLVSTVINVTLAAVVLGLPLTLLAVGAVRRRRKDDATLTALGASARTMRTAIAIDTAVVSAFALAGGMVIGAMTRILMTALQQGRLSLGPAVIDAPFLVGVEAVAWGAISSVGLVSVAIMTIAAVITAWATGRGSRSGRGSAPVEELRTVNEEAAR